MLQKYFSFKLTFELSIVLGYLLPPLFNRINEERSETIWCLFIICTIRTPNIFLRGTKYSA